MNSYLLAGSECIGENSSIVELLPHCLLELGGGRGGFARAGGGGWSENLVTEFCLIGGGPRFGRAGKFPRLTGTDCAATGGARGGAGPGADTLGGGGVF